MMLENMQKVEKKGPPAFSASPRAAARLLCHKESLPPPHSHVVLEANETVRMTVA